MQQPGVAEAWLSRLLKAMELRGLATKHEDALLEATSREDGCTLLFVYCCKYEYQYESTVVSMSISIYSCHHVLSILLAAPKHC